MNISQVGQSNTMVVHNTPHSIVGELQKQKMQLTKQLENVKAGNGDSKTKIERVKALNDQIEEINKQIQQAQIDEQKKEMEEKQQREAAKAEQKKYDNADENAKRGVILSASLNDLLVAKNDHHQVKEMSKVRTKLQGEKSVAEGEIKSALNGSSIKYQTGVVVEKGDTLSDLEGKIGKKMGKVKEDIDKSLKTGIAEAERAQANKRDTVEEIDGKKVNTQDQKEPVSVPVTDEVNVMVTQEKDKDKEKNIAKKDKPIDILA